jgi:hypothetical protein
MDVLCYEKACKVYVLHLCGETCANKQGSGNERARALHSVAYSLPRLKIGVITVVER